MLINIRLDKEVIGSYIQWNITQPLKKNEILPFVMTWMDLEVINV